jgi:enoyl-CoA hydratase/carnithine racemase
MSTPGEYQRIRYALKDHVATVTIVRPEARNALDNLANIELGQAFDAFAADPDAWVAIITGEGDKAFCAGNDLKAAARGDMLTQDQWSGGFGGLARRLDLFKPVIAAVNGSAFGGGFEIVLACDIVIAAGHARFALPEARIGKLAGAGGAHRLPRFLPWQRAMGMLLTGRDIDAATAHQWGLVNEVVPSAELPAAARRWAEELASLSPLALRAAKEAAVRGLQLPLEEAIATSFPSREMLRASPDFNEGARAFSEKRKPIWTGR